VLAPEPYLSACLEVIYRATINARIIGWAGMKGGLRPEQLAQIADLMDAIHSLPHLLDRWDEHDEELLRSFLEAFDQKWKGTNSAGLLAIYEDALRDHANPSS
jgi:hypothetical protein